MLLGSIKMHLVQPIYSNIQRRVRQEYKDALWLVKGRLNECEVEKMHRLDQVFLHFDGGEIITIEVGAGHARMKGAQSIIGAAVIEGCHYNTGAIPLRQLNELQLWRAFKLKRAKGG